MRAAPAAAAIHLAGMRWQQNATSETVSAARIPLTLPITLMPPSAPTSTRRKVVTRQARALKAWPISLATVSAAASASAATAPDKSSGTAA